MSLKIIFLAVFLWESIFCCTTAVLFMNYILMSSDLTEFPCTWFLLIIIARGGARHTVVGFLIRWLLDGPVLTRQINSDSAIGLWECLGVLFLWRVHLYLTALFSQRGYQGVFSMLQFQTTHGNMNWHKGSEEKSIKSSIFLSSQVVVNCTYGKSMARVNHRVI